MCMYNDTNTNNKNDKALEIIAATIIFVKWYKAKKKINHMSQSCRAHLFFGARLIQQNPGFEIFLLA